MEEHLDLYVAYDIKEEVPAALESDPKELDLATLDPSINYMFAIVNLPERLSDSIMEAFIMAGSLIHIFGICRLSNSSIRVTLIHG